MRILLVGYMKIQGPKGNSKFEILLVKIFNLKQKKSNIVATIKKSKIYSSSKQSTVPLDKGYSG